MNLSKRVLLLLESMAHDLFGEGEQALEKLEGQASGEGLLETAQSRLDALHVDLAEAEARETRLNLECQAAQTAADQASAAVDDALRQGDDEAAALRLQDARRLEAQARQLAESYQDSHAATTRLSDAVHTLQGHLDTARLQARTITERERSAEVLEELNRLEREMRRESAALQDTLARRQEQVAQREDRLAARQEMSRRPGDEK